MSDLDKIIRPFQTPDYSNPRPYFTQGQIGVPPVRLMVGRGGGGKTVNGNFSARITNYMTKYSNERKDE